MTLNLPRDNKSSCECEVMLASGQSLPQGSSLSQVHVNMQALTGIRPCTETKLTPGAISCPGDHVNRPSMSWGDFLMLGIRVCATDQGRFFTSKNPEQAPNFEVLLQNRILFDNLISNTPTQMSKIPVAFIFCFLQPDVFIFVLQSVSSFL